jgi:yersiniabactin nonribosomal peptide synthetase
LLDAPRISRHDSFFTLGGDSLLATRLVEAIRQEYAVPVSLRMLLATPTLAALAEVIERGAAASADLIEEGTL